MAWATLLDNSIAVTSDVSGGLSPSSSAADKVGCYVVVVVIVGSRDRQFSIERGYVKSSGRRRNNARVPRPTQHLKSPVNAWPCGLCLNKCTGDSQFIEWWIVLVSLLERWILWAPIEGLLELQLYIRLWGPHYKPRFNIHKPTTTIIISSVFVSHHKVQRKQSVIFTNQLPGWIQTQRDDWTVINSRTNRDLGSGTNPFARPTTTPPFTTTTSSGRCCIRRNSGGKTITTKAMDIVHRGLESGRLLLNVCGWMARLTGSKAIKIER